jgi:hypothetical protein
MIYNRKSRRMFLQGAGKSLLAIPFLPSLLPRTAWGQTNTAIKRYVTFVTDGEIGHNSAWLPNTSGSVTNLVQPNRILDPGGGHHPIHWQPLSEFISSQSTPLASLYGTSLNSHLGSMNIMRGLDFVFRYGHGSGSSLGALPDAEGARGTLAQIATIDAMLAANRSVNPSGKQIFCGLPGGWEGFSRNLQGGNSTLIDNIRQLYNALFNNGTYPEGGASGGTTTVAHPRRDILTRVMDDYRGLIGGRNISAVDRGALTNALDKFSDVLRGLAGITVPSPAVCSYRSLAVTDDSIGTAGSYAARSKILVDLITAAIMCDANRIFSFGLQMPFAQYSGITGPAGETLNYTGDWHQDVSHLPFTVRNGRPCWQWTASHQSYIVKNIFAPLVRNLAAATDPSNGQSYLYNSLIHLTYESGQVHSWSSHPTILAGNAGGAMSSGNYIDYSDRTKGTIESDMFSASPTAANFTNNYSGVSYNRLLVTIMQAMGMNSSDYEVNSRNSQVYNRTDIGSQNANLSAIGGYGFAFNADRNVSGWVNGFFNEALQRYDLRQFRNRLTLPS